MSPLAMAEWIEIPMSCPTRTLGRSPLAMAEWIEIITGETVPLLNVASPLAMAEWIEIIDKAWEDAVKEVSASDGGVD